jgi:flagellar biosynthetic protein FlhB
MAEQNSDQEDKTEEASAERRDEYREEGQIAQSADLTQVVALGAIVIFLSVYAPQMIGHMKKLLVVNFESLSTFRVNRENIGPYIGSAWLSMLYLIAPLFIVVSVISIVGTLLQTQFNWSWKALEFKWEKMNPISGIARMFNKEMVSRFVKTLAKLLVVTLVTVLILKGEWVSVPRLINYPLIRSWLYWSDVTKDLLWAITIFMLVVSFADYMHNLFTMERQMRMTKQEVKEEHKQREGDPHMKNRIRRAAREIANRKTLEKTKTATVIITNPTHYSIALRYEVGMPAPILVAKGVDFLALKMREIAKEQDIPCVENKPLARTLYASVKEGEEIPASMYKAVSEIIRYIFRMKGVKVPSKTEQTTPAEVN